MKKDFADIPLSNFKEKLFTIVDEEYKKLIPLAYSHLIQAGLAQKNTLKCIEQQVNKKREKTKQAIETKFAILEKQKATPTTPPDSIFGDTWTILGIPINVKKLRIKLKSRPFLLACCLLAIILIMTHQLWKPIVNKIGYDSSEAGNSQPKAKTSSEPNANINEKVKDIEKQVQKPIERPLFVINKDKSIHEETQNKLTIQLHLQFINIGKNPAEEVHFRSYFCPLSDPNRLEQASHDIKGTNTIYPGYPLNPWVQIWVEGQESSDLSKINNLILFYYCRLDYRDALAPSVSYSQDFYCIYNIGRKKLQDATLEIKEKFRPKIVKLIPPIKN